MTRWWPLLVVAGAALACVVLLARERYRARRGRTPDPAWPAQTPVQKFTGYDQAKAVHMKQAALDRERLQRKIADRRARPADVVSIDHRRKKAQ